jgi:hypothetical protein
MSLMSFAIGCNIRCGQTRAGDVFRRIRERQRDALWYGSFLFDGPEIFASRTLKLLGEGPNVIVVVGLKNSYHNVLSPVWQLAKAYC